MNTVIQCGYQPYETVIVIYYDTLTQQLVTQIISLVRENVSMKTWTSLWSNHGIFDLEPNSPITPLFFNKVHQRRKVTQLIIRLKARSYKSHQ